MRILAKITEAMQKLGILFIGLSSLVLFSTPAGYALKVQQGTVTIAAGQTSVNKSITAVSNLNKAFLLMWSSGDIGTDLPERWQATGYLSAVNQITFQRVQGTDDCQIGYYVIEAEYDEFTVVDRGVINIAAASNSSDKDIAASVDQGRSFIVANSRVAAATGSDTQNFKGLAMVFFVDNNTIRAQRLASGSYGCEVRYEVVEWSADSGVSVQANTYSGAISATEGTINISAVEPGRTWLYSTQTHASNGLSQMAVDIYLKDSTTIGYRRYTGSYNSGFAWWAIQFPASVVVQHDKITASRTDLTKAVNLDTDVTIANSWAFHTNDCNGTGAAFPRQAWYNQITATNQVTLTRYYSGQVSNITVQTIDTNAWVPAPTPTANAVTTAAVAAGANDNLILDVTLSENHNKAFTITSVKVDNVGTATDSEIEAVKLYYDSNNSNDYTVGVDQLVGSGTFSSGSKTFSGLSISVPASGTEDLFVVLDLADSVTDGHSLDVKIPANGITFSNGQTQASADINSAGTRTIDLVLDHFVVSHDNAAVAGLAENVSISAKDNLANTITDYTGTITLDTNGLGNITWANSSGQGSFNDGGAGSDTATYGFVAADNGTVTLTITDLLAETINISVSGDGKSDDNSEGDLVVSAGALDHFVLSHDNSAIAGSPDNVQVTAKDANQNTITSYAGQITLDTNGTASTITWAKLSGAGNFSDGGSEVDTATYTFDASDAGTAIFTITDTKTESLDIDVSGGGKSDDDTEGDMVVGPASLDHFRISHDTSATAGIAESVSVTALDQYGNTKTDYTGQITLDTDGTVTAITWANVSGNGVFSDGGAGSDTATYTYAEADNGVVGLSITDTKAETINIAVSGDGKTDNDAEGNLVVSAGAIDHFVISHDGVGVSGVAEAITITAKDNQGNTIDTYAGTITMDTNGSGDIVWAKQTGAGVFNDGGAGVDTATYAYVDADDGVVVLTITDDTAENLDIDASGDGKTDNDTEGTLNIASSGLDHFVIAHDGNAIVSTSENITITAKNANGDTVTSYQGTITIDTNGTANAITWANVSGNGVFSDGGAGSDTATYTFSGADNGTVIVSITDTSEETINIAVTAEGKSDDNTEGNLVINPAGLHHFVLVHDGSGQAGLADNVTITAKDANNATVTNYSGTITMDTNGTATAIGWSKVSGSGTFVDGGSSVDTATYTFVSGDNGQCTLSITATKVETFNISASGSGKTDDNSEGDFSVSPGVIDYFKITHDASATAGIQDNVIIVAYDAYGNTKTDYSGQITVDTNGTATAISWAKVSGGGNFVDGGAGVDTATYTYISSDNGSVTLGITDTKTETINIAVSGSGKTDDNSEGNLVIGPAAIEYFVVTHDGVATAGIAESVGVTAYDTYGNTKTNYTGTITLDTSGTATTITWAKVSGSGTFVDGGASVDTATYTFDVSDNGTAGFTITDTKKENLNIQVSGSSKTDQNLEGDLTIGPATIHHFVIAHDGFATAGQADNVVITAYDAYDNIKDDYTGTITVDTNGTATTITWAKVSGSGTFVDGGASVDTATYTYTDNDDGVVTLSITDTTAETLDIDAADGAYVDTDTEGNLTVSASAVDHFVIGHDGTAIVDSFEPVTITVKDQYANTLTTYTGTITVSTLAETGEITWSKAVGDGSFSDGGAGVDTATYTYTVNDSGVVTLNIKNSAADQAVDIEVSGSGKSDDDTEGTMAFSSDSIVIDNSDTNANPPRYYDVGANWSTRTGGTEYGTDWRRNTVNTGGQYAYWVPNITVTGNYEVAIVHTTTDMATNAPFTVFYDGGNTTIAVDEATGGGPTDWKVLGTFKFAAGTSGYVRLENLANNNVCADAVRWIMKGSASATANAVTTGSVAAGASDVLVLDVRVDNNTATADTITSVSVENSGTASDSEISAVKLYYDSDNNGSYTYGVDQQVGSGTFVNGIKTFSGLNITLAGNGSEYLFVTLDVATTINDGDTLDVRIPINGLSLSNAPTIETIALNSSGTRQVVIDLDHFVITHDGSATAGSAEAVSVTAKDLYNNTKTGYDGIITFDTNGSGDISWAKVAGAGVFTDNGAGSDTATYDFEPSDEGTMSVTITDLLAETINISISGSGKTDDNSEGNLVISPAGLDHFLVSHDAAASAGSAELITVTAKDANNNTVSDYTGQITLDTSGTANAITWALQTGFGSFLDGGAGSDTASYTFVVADNSSAVFAITDTKAESIDIDVSGDAKTDDDSEGNLVVVAAALDHFVVSHDTTAEAGAAENVSITAKDQYDNTKTSYNGQITVDTNGTATAISWAKVQGAGVFSDGGIDSDTCTYTYDISDNGTVTLAITATTIENLDIDVSGDAKTDDDSEGNLIVGPGALEYFAITHDGIAMQNQPENIIIKAYDAYNNLKTNYTGTITVDTNGDANNITWAKVSGGGNFVDGGAGSDTATYTYVAGDSGQVTLSLTDATAEIINISVSGNGKTDNDNEGVLDVVAAGFHHFKIVHDHNAVEGVAENITIYAKDANNETVTNFSGVITVDTNGTASAITWAKVQGAGVFTDGGAGVDTATYDFDTSDNGVVILALTDTVQETINISATGSGKSDDDTEGNLLINPAGINYFSVWHDTAAVAGEAENIIIVAKDANNQTVTNYTGTISLDTNGTAGAISWAKVQGAGVFNDGGAGSDTATYQFAEADSGQVTLSIIDTKAETIDIDVSGSGKSDDDTEDSLVISPAGIHHFVIGHDTAAEAGVAENITVTAKDQYANTITSYSGTITLDTNGTATAISWAKVSGGGNFVDGGAGVDTATYTYVSGDNGIVTLSITDTMRENINISVSGDSKSDDDTEGLLNVSAGVLDHFELTHDNAAVAGQADSVTVTAYDSYGNIKTNYTGTITLDTNGTATAISWAKVSGGGNFVDGGSASDTATYSFVSSDVGTATFSITDTKAETIDIDVSGSGKFDDDTEGNLVVAPANLNHFSISHDATAIAGQNENIIIYARDYYNNNIDTYTGTITVDTNGTADSIAWSKISGAGVFSDGGAGSDTAIYTYADSDDGVVTLAINDQRAESINISVSASGKYDDDSEGNLVVAPAELASFIISHDGQAIQSVAENITVTAKDTYGNIKSNYTGQITLDTNGTANTIVWALSSGSGVFVDGGAGVDTATYTYASQDAGIASFTITDSTAETIDIDCNDGGIFDTDSEGNLVIQASSTTVDATANALSSAYVGVSQTNNLVLDITLTNNNILQADTIQSVTVENAGTIPDNQITAVKLYYDSNNSQDYTSGVDTQVGTGTFSSGSVTFSNLGMNLVAAGTEELYVVFDLGSDLSDGTTVDARIPINGLDFANAPNAEDTALNSNGILSVDSVKPTLVSGLASSSHNNAIGAWNDPQSRDNTVFVSWNPATDSSSGLDGYSILWDTSPSTLPDTTKDIEESVTSQISTALANGNAHYFHIRSVDNVGNWADSAQHLGPFYIDSEGPTLASIYQILEIAGQDYLHVSGANTIYYSGKGYSAFKVYVEAADSHCGLKEAVFPTTTSAGGTDASEAGTNYEYEYIYEVTSAGSSYNPANVVVFDMVGNSTNVAFNVILDNTPPAAVANFYSSTHTPNVSSSDNDITFNWSDVSDSQSGVSGYSIIVDSNNNTVAPQYKNVNTGVQTYTEYDLPNGTYYAHIRAVDNVGNWSSTTHAGPYIIERGSLTATLSVSDSVVSTGQQFSVTMTVYNSGGSTVNGVDPSNLTVTSTGAASASTSSNPAAQNIDVNNQKQFQWFYTAGASAGTIRFSGNAAGTDNEGIVTSNTAQSADVVVEQAAAVTVNCSASPSTANIGQTITVTVTVSNIGGAEALNVAPNLNLSGTASPLLDSGPSPASANIRGGQSKQFSYTAHATQAGTATFTANISSGTDENSGNVLTATNSQDSVTVSAPSNPELTSSISATPVVVQPNDTITVTMSVQNTGSGSISNITPSTLVVGGTSSDASLSSGPVPASISSLSQGDSQNFTWTYTAGSTIGSVTFSGYADGTQADSASTSSNEVTIQAEAAALSSSLTATPSAVLTQGTIVVTMHVTNTAAVGGAAANSVKPSVLTLGGTSAQANLLTGPTPASANIGPGQSQDFVFSYAATSTEGTINFTGNATGTDANSANTVSSTATTSNNVTVSALSAIWQYPTGSNVTGPIRSVPLAYNGEIIFGSDDNNLYVINDTTKQLDHYFTASGAIRGFAWPDTEDSGGGVDKDIYYFGTLGNTVYALWEDNTLKWERVMAETLSTITLYDSAVGVYFGTQNNKVYGLSVADGSDIWSQPASVGGAPEANPAMVYVPSLLYDVVYFGANDGKLYAFQADNGNIMGTFDTGDGSSGAIQSSPVIAPVGDRLLLFFGSDNGKFYAVNAENMQSNEANTGWASPYTAGAAIRSAAWFDISTHGVYFGCQDGKLYGLNMEDGTNKTNFPVNIGAAIDSWPLVWNGVAYFGADDGKFYAVYINDVAGTPQNEAGTIVPGWPYDTDGAIKGGASLHYIDDDNIFVLIGSDAGRVYSFKVVQ